MALNFFYQLVAAFKILKENLQLVHRDMKPKNVLVKTIDNLCCMKISNFSTSIMGYQRSTVITEEIGRTNNYDDSVYIYSLGVTLFYMMFLKLPENNGFFRKILLYLKIRKN